MRKIHPFPFAGGLDLVSPAISKGNGHLLFSKNIEPSIFGGYKQSSGYERYDGQTRPSATTKTIDGNLETTSTYHFLSTANKVIFDAEREVNRTAILAVPGSGDILGVCVYDDNVYVFRNNAGGTAAVMHKATGSGWTTVTTPALVAGGKYEFDVYNFGSTPMLYGCNGVDKAFQFDGTTFTQITSGFPTDTPNHIKAHKEHLFLSFTGGHLLNSKLGAPTDFTGYAAKGDAAEYFIKEDVTALASNVENVLTIFGDNQILLLYGTSVLDFDLKTYSNTAGAYEWTVATESTPIFFGDSGISIMSSVQEFGDFQAGSLSTKIKPWLDNYKAPGSVAGVALDFDNNLFRMYMTDGKIVNLQFNGQKGGDILTADYELGFTCIGQGKVSGESFILAGCDDGFVYQMEIGNSMDGANIESFGKLSFAHMNSPQRYKNFFKFVIEVESPSQIDILYTPDFSYGNVYRPAANSQTSTVESEGGDWGISKWDQFFWSNQIVGEAEGFIEGQGKNISMSFYTTTLNTLPYTLQALIIHYSVRGYAR